MKAKTPTMKAAYCLIVTFIVATVLATNATTATADHAVPRVTTYTDPNPDHFEGAWSGKTHNCGSWGCSNREFQISDTKNAQAVWKLPDMQGVYTLSVVYGKHFGTEKRWATGRVRWTVEELRTGSDSWRTVRVLYDDQYNKLGWYTWRGVKLELDGKVKITATNLSDELVGVQDVRLNKVDLLPEHRSLGKILCIDGITDALFHTKNAGDSALRATGAATLSALVGSLFGPIGTAIGFGVGALWGVVDDFAFNGDVPPKDSVRYNEVRETVIRQEPRCDLHSYEYDDNAGYFHYAQVIAEKSARRANREPLSDMYTGAGIRRPDRRTTTTTTTTTTTIPTASSRSTNTTTTTTTTTMVRPETSRPPVSVTVGDSAQGQRNCSSSACRWLHISINESVLGPGPHTVVCAHDGVPERGYGPGAWTSATVSGNTANRVCYFGFPGAYVYAIVGAQRTQGGWTGGYRSDRIRWP